MADIEQLADSKTQTVENWEDSSKAPVAVGQEHLAGVTPPHESYEGYHRFDPDASWSPQEERAVVLKTDLMLLIWVCVMVRYIYIHTVHNYCNVNIVGLTYF